LRSVNKYNYVKKALCVNRTTNKTCACETLIRKKQGKTIKAYVLILHGDTLCYCLNQTKYVNIVSYTLNVGRKQIWD